METVPYILMQDRLSTGGSFILCDCNARGFPIRYASPGFCELFGYCAAECKGQKCGDLVAEPSIRKHSGALKKLAAATKLSAEEVSQALAYISKFAALECEAMMAHPTEVTGLAVVPNRHRRGQVKVIEVAMLVCRHPKYGWSYTVGVQTDVSHELSMQKLLGAVLDGTYPQLVKAQEPRMRRRLHLLNISSRAANQYFDFKAGEMWESLIFDLLGVEVQSLGATSDFSTTSGGKSACDAASCADSYKAVSTSSKGRNTAPCHQPQEAAALPETIEVVEAAFKQQVSEASTFKPQVSEASTMMPEQELQAFSRNGTDEAAFGSVDEAPSLFVRGLPPADATGGPMAVNSTAVAALPKGATACCRTSHRSAPSERAALFTALLVGSAAAAAMLWQRRLRERR